MAAARIAPPVLAGPTGPFPLEGFHPAVRTWFARRFPDGPTEPQAHGWPLIAGGRDTLIAAPTGSGKTLAAFLVCIDRLWRRHAERGAVPERVEVVYVSPLKALAADIRENLERPLREIADVALELGLPSPELRVALRTGDTPAADRSRMLRQPPHFLVTTPESLFLLLTAERSREILRGVRTVIVDEIHAVAGDKRGAHLAVTVERLAALARGRLQRVGLSATQKPLDEIGELLAGFEVAEDLPLLAGGATAGEGEARARARPVARPCSIVDLGHRRELDLALEVPGSALEAVCSHEQWDEILDRIAGHVRAHRTTLVFVNTRRLAERLAHLLAERLGQGAVAAHHGSLSRERRLRVEARLRGGELRALVATASLELGIDIGPVELVCQVGSPRRIATFLQRVGRSGHARAATPKGVLYPTTRDELLECAALLRAVRAGELDRIDLPDAPLDILAQQVVAACAAEPMEEEALFRLLRRSRPFRALTRAEFDEVLEVLAQGVDTGRGRRGAWLHRDRVHGVVRARRGARLAALTSGGAIPETADYRVVADPDETFIGTVNEDWAVESQKGDIFLLGTHSWRIRRVEGGVVRVVDAGGAPPTIPFWLGEAPARSAELSRGVAELREEVARRLDLGGTPAAVGWLAESCGLSADAAEQVAAYVEAGRTALGVLPGARDIVFERFVDESGGSQVVVHAPFGGRVNRGLGLLLRKRFCVRFDFELQAAANDDVALLSLGARHGFPLEMLGAFLRRAGAPEALTRAVVLSPLFPARWRWNLGRSLLVLRFRGGRRVPPPIQRMEADDLMAALFPGLAQCQENATGPMEIPDHPLVRQTVRDCLHEAVDLPRLLTLLEAVERGEVRLHFRDTTEPSPFAHEILSGRPFTFLDDAPLEERRSRAVPLPRGLPAAPRDHTRIDPEAVARVGREARPEPRDAEELHDLLMGLGVVSAAALAELAPHPEREGLLAELAASRRVGRFTAPRRGAPELLTAAECVDLAGALFPEARLPAGLALPPALAGRPAPEPEEAAERVLRGHLECTGACTPSSLAEATGLPPSLVDAGLARLEAAGFLARGRFGPGPGEEQVCSRRLLARMHHLTRARLRASVRPVSARDFMRFLLRWQHAAPGVARAGRRGVLAVVEQLQGFEVQAGALEGAVLPARVAGYRSEWLDALCLSGEVVWGRMAVSAPDGGPGWLPSRATGITLARREDWPWLVRAVRGDRHPEPPTDGPGAELLRVLSERGALFAAELAEATPALRAAGREAVDAALLELVARGLVAADGFEPLRALLRGRRAGLRRVGRPGTGGARRRLRTAGLAPPPPSGRFARLPEPPADLDPHDLAEALAEQLLARYGVVFRDLLGRETLALSWRELVAALRRLEDRGQVRGGRFVAGFAGEHFARPDAVELLEHVRSQPRRGEEVELSAADPLNLVGVILPGPRIPAVAGARIRFRDGLPERDDPRVGARP